MTSLGWHLQSGLRIDDHDVRHLAATTVEALLRLDCFATEGRRHGDRPTPSGRQFARAALRA